MLTSPYSLLPLHPSLLLSSIDLQSTRPLQQKYTRFLHLSTNSIQDKIACVEQAIIKVDLQIDAVESQIQSETNRSHPDQLHLTRLWREKKDLRKEKKDLRTKEMTLLKGINTVVVRRSLVRSMFHSNFVS